MISLKRTLNQMEEYERRFTTALECYLAAIGDIEANAVPVHGDLVYHHQTQLRSLRRALKAETSAETLTKCRSDLGRELADYSEKSRVILARKDDEIRKIIRTLAAAAATLADHSETRSTRLARFTKRLEEISHIDDLSRIREKLSEEVSDLKSFAEAVKGESFAEFEQLRRELTGFQQRLEQAEALAGTDRLTGVANRVEGERKMEEAIHSGQHLCILLLDLDDFKCVNDRYGHQVGDLALKTFARRLALGVRPHDTVCRWGGDEFLVILPKCTLEAAIVRAKELSEKCAKEYNLPYEGRSVRVSIRASIGAAEHQKGESSDELFRRADRFLYREKKSDAGILAGETLTIGAPNSNHPS